MSNPNSPEARKLAKEITDLRKLQKASHIASRLPYSSVPQDQPLVVTDQDGNVVNVIGAPNGNPETGDQLVLPGKEPSKPSLPILSAYLGTITATWDGTYVNEYVAPDLHQIEVHSSTDDDFETSAGTRVGVISGQRGGSITMAVDYGTHYVRFVAVSTSGSRSPESDIASVEVTPLVEVPEMTEILDDINERYDGVVTEAQQLNDKLTQAEQTLNTTRQDLDNLENVRLPQVEANIEAAHQEIVATGAELDSRLDQAQLDLTAHANRLTANESSLKTLNDTTLPQLQRDLDTAEASLSGLSGRLGTAESELTNTRTELNNKLDSAFNKITDADGKAQSAINMAGTKNQVFYGTAVPTATSPKPSVRGDLYRRIDADTNITSEYQWSGSTWVQQLVTTTAISNLDVGKLTAGSAAISNLVVEKLWAEVIRAKKILADQVLIGSGSNLIVDPFFDNEEIRNYRSNSSSLSGSYGHNANLNLRWFGGTQSLTSAASFFFHATPTRDNKDGMIAVADGPDVYRFKARVNAVGGKARWNARVLRKDGTLAFLSTGFGKPGYWHSGSSGQWMEDTWAVPDDVAYFIPYIVWETSTTTAHVYGGASVRDMTDGSLVVAGSITGDHIEANSVAAKIGTFLQLNADQISAGTISTDRLNVNDIAAKTAAFQKVDVKNLFATNSSMDSAVISKLYTDIVRSRKMTTDQLLVGQGENLVPWDVFTAVPENWDHISGYGGGPSKNPTRQVGAGVVDNDHLYMVADWVTAGTDTITWRMSSRKYDTAKSGWIVEPGEDFLASAYVKAGGSYTTYPKVRIGLYWYDAAGTYISGRVSEQHLLNWSWTKLEIDGKAPATALYALIYIRQDQPGGVRVDLPALYRKKTASLIVDGAIEAKHITASESMSAKIGQFLKLDVKDLVSTGTSTLNEAVVNKLWTDVVHSRKITSDMVLVGAGNNLIPNSALINDLSGWENSVSTLQRTVGANGPTPTTPYMYVTTRGNVRSTRFTVTGGKEYRFSMSAQAAAAGSVIFVQVNTDGASNPYAVSNVALTTTWRTITGTVKLPDDATTAYVNIYVNHTNGTTTTQRFAYMAFNQMSDGELIVDGAITSTKILANTIEAGHIKANAITADKIEAGAIKAEHIAARVISADKLRIGQGSNVFPDPLMKDAAGWPSTSTNVYTGGFGSSNRVRVTAGTGQTGGYYGNGSDDVRRFPVVPGRSYMVSTWIRPTVNISADNCIAIYTRLVAETGSTYTWPSPSAVMNSAATTGVSTIAANTWVKMEGRIDVPADATNTFIIPGLYVQSTFPTGSSCDFSNLNISEMTTGELIVEGSITSDKIKAGAITADKLDADAITGKTITGGSINGSRYTYNGSGAGAGYNLNISNDTYGAYLGFDTPSGTVKGTIRAFDEDPWSEISAPTLTLRSPAKSGYTDRPAVKITAGTTNGTGGLIDFTGNIWARGEIRGRYQISNTQGDWAHLELNNISSGFTGTTSPTLRSMGMYNREYTSSANVYITTNGYLGRSTSVRAAKLAIEDIPQEQIDALLNVSPRWWFDKADAEKLADYTNALNNPECPYTPESILDVPNNLTRIPGLIAEEVAEAGATAFVTYDRDDEGDLKLSGVNYDRVGPALLSVVKTQKDKITELESRLATIESQVGIN